jgi:hypothetical protein
MRISCFRRMAVVALLRRRISNQANMKTRCITVLKSQISAPRNAVLRYVDARGSLSTATDGIGIRLWSQPVKRA